MRSTPLLTLPWLDYTGQSTQELIACKNTHRIDSLLCALEEGIQAKERQDGEAGLTDEERVVLAVRALDREVNNGGFSQFFANSSRRFVPIIVDSLRRIDLLPCIVQPAIRQYRVVNPVRRIPVRLITLNGLDRGRPGSFRLQRTVLDRS